MAPSVRAAASFSSPIRMEASKSPKLRERGPLLFRLPRAIHGERFLQNARGGFRKMKSGEFLFAGESNIGYVASGTGFTSEAFTEIIHNHKVKSRPVLPFHAGCPIIHENSVEHFDHVENANFDSRFFQQLASDAMSQTLAEFQRSARD